MFAVYLFVCLFVFFQKYFARLYNKDWMESKGMFSQSPLSMQVCVCGGEGRGGEGRCHHIGCPFSRFPSVNRTFRCYP